jgi:hypothetical protein
MEAVEEAYQVRRDGVVQHQVDEDYKMSTK